jgi:hypothetical protein
MFCSSCGKKITENSKFCKYCGASQTETEEKKKKIIKKKDYETVWTCDYCKEEFKTKEESDKHELYCAKNPNKRKRFFKNLSQRAWFWIWIMTLLVFTISLLINSKFFEYGFNLLNSEYLMGFWLFNILVGINAFLAMIISSIKKNNKDSFFTSKILFICLAYFLISTSVFAVEGLKAKNDEEYKNKYYVEIKLTTPTPVVEVKVTPTVVVKKTVNPVQKAVDTDPIVNCTMTAECGGGIKKVRESECKNGTCCQIGSSWIFYTSKQKCIEDQNNAKPKTVNNPQIVPTTAVYSPPNANKSAVFLSYSGNTIYCPSQNVDAIKSINSTMESKKSEWASKYNECTSNFYKTNSCCVSCKQTFDSGAALCNYTNDCLSGLSEEYKDCLRKCPSASDYCQYVYDEQKSLSSQITNLCK